MFVDTSMVMRNPSKIQRKMKKKIAKPNKI